MIDPIERNYERQVNDDLSACELCGLFDSHLPDCPNAAPQPESVSHNPRPLTAAEIARGQELAAQYGLESVSLPLGMVSVAALNEVVDALIAERKRAEAAESRVAELLKPLGERPDRYQLHNGEFYWADEADEVFDSLTAQLNAASAEVKTGAQVEHMTRRFLVWKLPENFNPDGGISFKKAINQDRPTWPQKNEPVGTNLFDYDQAKDMVHFMLEDLPAIGNTRIAHLLSEYRSRHKDCVDRTGHPDALPSMRKDWRCELCKQADAYTPNPAKLKENADGK